MKSTNRQIRIVITGPESTGKTTLAKQLAEYLNGIYIPEFAREYIEKLSRHYTYDDVDAIANKQLEQYQATMESSGQLYIFDTWLIITKVWFNWVFSKTPEWLDGKIRDCPVDVFLLCLPDLPWEADTVRENGGENRLKLLEEYRKELTQYGFTYVEICGNGEARLQSAIDAIASHLRK
jgi:NadR type nicotinamide-nucleotide adenylyltransferase